MRQFARFDDIQRLCPCSVWPLSTEELRKSVEPHNIRVSFIGGKVNTDHLTHLSALDRVGKLKICIPILETKRLGKLDKKARVISNKDDVVAKAGAPKSAALSFAHIDFNLHLNTHKAFASFCPGSGSGIHVAGYAAR